MLSRGSFRRLVQAIQSQGYSLEDARRFAVLISDRPCFDRAGNLVVMESGKLIATLKPTGVFSSLLPHVRRSHAA